MRVTRRLVVVIVCGVGGAACSGGPERAAPPEAVGTSASADTTECNSGPYVDGVDVYDGTGTIDWKAVKASGVDFAIIKATQGNYDTQSTFATNWAGAKAAGVLRSAYHFFDATIDGKTQANYFVGVMGKLEPGDLPPMLDIECPDGDPNCLGFASGAASSSAITTAMNDWLTTVQASTGLPPIVYTFETYFSSNGVDTTGLENYPLDIAYPTTSTCFGVPSPWTSATIWQNSWTATVGGISGQVDTDRYLGTLAQLKTLTVGGGGSTPTFSAPSQVNGNLAMTVVSWTDGHVELFAERTEGSAIHVYTTGFGDSWSPAASISGQSSCGIASVAWPPKESAQVSIYDALPDGTTEDIAYASGAWAPFSSFGGAGLSHMSTLAHADGRVEVFALGTDGAIWDNVRSALKKSWSGWRSLGGKVVTGAAPIVWGDGRAEIFATDASGVAWHDGTAGAKSTTWGGWQAMTGGKLASRPIPVRWADGHLQAFARGADDALYTSNWTTGAWPAFTAVNADTQIQGEPSVVVYPAYGPEVFARDPKGELLHAWTESTGIVPWAADFNQVLASDPLVWMRPDGQAEVFGVDEMGDLVKSIHNGPSWSTWSTLATGVDACTSVPIPPPPRPDAGTPGDDGGRPPAADGGNRPPPGSGAPTRGSSGCGCVTAGGDKARDGWVLASGALLAAVARRRRRPAVWRIAASGGGRTMFL